MITAMINILSKIFTGRLAIIRLLMLTSAILLFLMGLAMIYAAGNPARSEQQADPNQAQQAVQDTYENKPDAQSPLAFVWKRQIIYAIAGILAFLCVNLIDYRRLGAVSYWLYAGVLILLTVLVLDIKFNFPFVPVVKGARRWIRIGSFVQIQPSEFCKIAYILALAWYLRFRSNYRTIRGLIGPFALTVLAMILILLEPDLGTVLLMMPILFSMLFVAGARVRHLLLVMALAVLVSPLLWHFMEDYQRMRISCVLLQNEKIFNIVKKNPRIAKVLVGDPDKLRTWKRNEGYQLIHSKQAIASGGLTGYGFAKGPYNQYNYLPERHNDFVFAMVAHQWGLVGCGLVLVLYVVIFAGGLEIAYVNTDPFGRLAAVGIVAMFAVEVIVNISMTLGLTPITGLTLPFVSYGGSSLLGSFIALGLLNNIGRIRPFSVAGKPFEYAEQ